MMRAITVSLLCLATTSAQAGGFLSGGLTTSPAPELSVFTGVPSFQAGLGRTTTVWGAARFAQVRIDDPAIVLTGVEPQIGVRQTFGDTSVVHTIANIGVYTRFWAVGGDDFDSGDFETDTNASLRPILGTNAAMGLDAPVSENLSLSVLLGIDYFTAGYQYGGWVSQGGLFTTYASANINLWL